MTKKVKHNRKIEVINTFFSCEKFTLSQLDNQLRYKCLFLSLKLKKLISSTANHR